MADDRRTLNELAKILRRNGWKVSPPRESPSHSESLSGEKSDYANPAWRLGVSGRAHSYLARFYHDRSSDRHPFDRRTSPYMQGGISAAQLAEDFKNDPLMFYLPPRFGVNSLLLLEQALRDAGYLEGWVNPIDQTKLE